MRTALTVLATAAVMIWLHRRRRHPLNGWVRAFYDEAVLS